MTIKKHFIVNYEGWGTQLDTQAEAEDYAKRKAHGNQNYKWIIYEAISSTKVPAPAVEIVAIA